MSKSTHPVGLVLSSQNAQCFYISAPLKLLAATIISDSFTYIFNQAITLYTFPHKRKTGRVIYLFKNCKRNLPGNYRPITVLPAIGKVMEGKIYVINFMNI